MSTEAKVVVGSTPAELESKINSATIGRKVQGVSHSQGGSVYSATILMDKEVSGRQRLVEG